MVLKMEARVWDVAHLPPYDFQFGPKTKTKIEGRVNSVIKDFDMTLGESQVLSVLTTMQYLAKVGPKSLGLGQVAQCVLWGMQPLQEMEIAYPPQAILGYTEPNCLRAASVKTDLSVTDMSSLPSSVALAGDLL